MRQISHKAGCARGSLRGLLGACAFAIASVAGAANLSADLHNAWSVPRATGAGFAVSCPRAHGVAIFSASGSWRGFVPLDEACALAASPARLWAGGRLAALDLSSGEYEAPALRLPAIWLDNHWIASS